MYAGDKKPLRTESTLIFFFLASLWLFSETLWASALFSYLKITFLCLFIKWYRAPNDTSVSMYRRLHCFFFFFKISSDVDHFKSLLNLLQYCFCFMFWIFGQEACGILVPQPGIKPAHPCSERQSLNHWTIREVPLLLTHCNLLQTLKNLIDPGLLWWSSG